jgi:hypothetical protein
MSEGSETPSMQGSMEAAGSSPALVAPQPVAIATPVPRPQRSAPTQHSGSWWTIPLLCAGIGLITCAIVVGQVEDNRKLAWQREILQRDLKYFQDQINTNQAFLSRLSDDANLVERLAQRQTKMVRKGAAILDLGKDSAQEDTSPFRLVNIPPPPNVKPYEPSKSIMSILFSHPRVRLYAYGVGAFLIARSLITGASDLPSTQRNG